ncbi:uncharacterized protein LOC121712059 isoform X2 [Alosa sapidissima]|uniref:uncharacterized protein LOC121712059 isoform X2 n=1 Tax=Alosa sapidissima TaxID=34773 RepID=UPI001C091489|nr:uncharacterized protein LOC121712059 isoform X2 [Alosa sapidissima]
MMFIASFSQHRQRRGVRGRKVSRCTYQATSTITKIILDGSTPVQLCEAVCSCVAGKVLCNHNVALLYQTAHYSQLHLSAVPPVLSCTETEQRWHKPRTMGVKPGRVRDMVVMAAKPKQRTVGGGVRSTLYKAVKGELPDPNVLRVAEVYADFPAELAPLITTLAISPDIPLVDSALGKVQEGSLIAMQHPVVVSRCIQYHPDAPPPPPLPLADYRLEPTTCQFVCSLQEQLHLVSLQTSWEAARQVEASTRDQSLSAEWYRVRSQRVTSSHFKEVCHIRGESAAQHLAERMRKGVVQTAAMKRGLALEPVAVEEYSRVKNINYWPCGFVIHPDAPWLGYSPDGLLFDPTENPPFGLVEIKCPNAKSYVDCKYLRSNGNTMSLKRQHVYYWQVQGQLLVTGMEWCDFVVFAEDDMVIQRIYRDTEIAEVIRERGDHFFFYFYMSVCLK